METKTEQNSADKPALTGDVLIKLLQATGKKSFLVFSQNKYFTVPVERIAFFRVQPTCSVLCCFDNKEYFINYSLEQIQSLLSAKQFFRLNRQYLLNFHAVKEVEPFYGRKLIVNLVTPVTDALLVSKDRVIDFLTWLDNR